jgi:polynucleotide 5'-hydroxyl-kinase GRC3/NOL9
MRRTVEKGKTLLVDGPASVNLLSGEAKILGARFGIGEKVVIRDGKRLPFQVSKKTVFDLRLGENASFEEVYRTTIPISWESAFKEVVSQGRPVTVMVMGGVDSGKTSFCVYLANRALRDGLKPAVVDGDLGQSDIGPPSTIGFGRVTKPMRDLFEMEAENACFVGVTSPSLAVNKVVEGLTAMKSRVLQRRVNFLIVNTDGWIEGEEAVGYKVQLAEIVVPDVVVGIQHKNELTSILTLLKEKMRVIAIESPQVIRKRNREKRKTLRELGYKKYLREAKVRLFPLNQIRVEDALSETGGRLATEQMEGIEEGLLVALQDAEGSFLGIGVLCGVEPIRGVMRIYTPVGENVSTVCVGQVKLDREGREVGLSPVFAQTSQNYLKPKSKNKN